MKLCNRMLDAIRLVRVLAGLVIIANGVAPLSGASHRTNSIEGWRVLVNERLLQDDKVATDKALGLLRVQLQEILRVVPPMAVAKLREVPLWFSPEYPGVKPTAEYHPGAGWLRDHGRDPAMAKGVVLRGSPGRNAWLKRELTSKRKPRLVAMARSDGK